MTCLPAYNNKLAFYNRRSGSENETATTDERCKVSLLFSLDRGARILARMSLSSQSNIVNIILLFMIDILLTYLIYLTYLMFNLTSAHARGEERLQKP